MVAGQEQQQQQDPAVVAAATAAAAANALSALQREERSRVLRERQNEERQRKLEELKQHVIIIFNILAIFDRICQRINQTWASSSSLSILKSHAHFDWIIRVRMLIWIELFNRSAVVCRVMDGRSFTGYLQNNIKDRLYLL